MVDIPPPGQGPVGPDDHGLLVSFDDADQVFRDRVTLALDMIYDVTPGRLLLDGLIARFDQSHRVVIARGQTNQCRSGTDRVYTRMARAMIADQTDRVQAITAALIAQGRNNQDGFEHTAERINNVPRYRLEEPVAVAAGAYGVTGQHIRAWATGTAAFPDPLTDNEGDLRNALLIALQNEAHNGLGTSSRVEWNPNGWTITIAGEQVYRGPFLGLAHELVHAWHNIRGGQLGADNNDRTTVLFEYMCVGLGEWQVPAGLDPNDEGLPISENGIRRGWGTDLRLRY